MLALHLLWVGLRVPYSVVFRRMQEVARFRDRGAAASHLESGRRSGAAIVEWVLRSSQEHDVVLFRGPRKGALEFVPALLHPRLLVEAAATDRSDPHYRGRPIAIGTRDGKRGQIVIIGDGDKLGVELR
ncbi:MAG: hypothetical protein AB7T19_17625 [Planctomycetota bacterium]